MLSRLEVFHKQPVQRLVESVQRGRNALHSLDGASADKNASRGVVSVASPSGKLDAVLLSNPDGSETIVQRLRKPDGSAITTWLEIPPKGLYRGFEIESRGGQTSGLQLDVEERMHHELFASWPQSFYVTRPMHQDNRESGLARAEFILSGHGCQI